MSPTPPARVRLTVAKRPMPDVAVERAPDARLGKFVHDLPAEWVARYLRVQAAYWVMRQELAERTGR